MIRVNAPRYWPPIAKGMLRPRADITLLGLFCKMSEELELRKLLHWEQFRDRIRVDTKHCLKHVNKQCVSDKDIILTVHLPYECIRKWSDAKNKISRLHGEASSYIKLLNTFLQASCGYKVKERVLRVEKRLEKACSEVKRKFIGKSGSAYRKLCQKELDLALMLTELVTVSEVESGIATEKLKREEIEKENEQIKKSLAQIQDVHGKKMEELCSAQSKVEELSRENNDLKVYVEQLGQDLSFQNYNRKITQVSDRQQRRKLSEIKSHTAKALWFAKTFGLDVQHVHFMDDRGRHHTFTYEPKKKKGYHELSEEEKQKVQNVLFILDKFCIGDAAYHELTMLCENNSLPRSYLIKQCKDEMNKINHIVRTPGPAQGAQLDFITELKSVVQDMVSSLKFNYY